MITPLTSSVDSVSKTPMVGNTPAITMTDEWINITTKPVLPKTPIRNKVDSDIGAATLITILTFSCVGGYLVLLLAQIIYSLCCSKTKGIKQNSEEYISVV